jgi:hypothetical protein
MATVAAVQIPADAEVPMTLAGRPLVEQLEGLPAA